MRILDSTKYSNDTLAQSKRDSVNSAETKENQKKDNERFITNLTNQKAVFNLQSKATQAQIDALNETKKQFEEENEPYLEISEIAVKRFEIGKPILIEFYVKNLSQQTVKEDSTQTAIEYIDIRDYNAFTQNPFGFITLAAPVKKTQYYVKESPSIQYLYVNTPIATLTKEQFDSFRNGTLFLFIMGRYKYHNIRNFKKKTYEFAIQLHVNTDMNSKAEFLGRTSFDFIYNENKNGW